MEIRNLCASALLVLAACSTGVDANNPYDPDAPPSLQAPARLSGVVTADGLPPPAGLAVQLLRQGLPSDEAQVDAAGRFTFDGLTPGLYAVTIELDGFRPYSSPSLALTVGQTAELAPIDLRPEDRAEVLVTVTGSAVLAGQPSSSGILVRVAGRAATAITDAAGAFTLELAPGTYDLSYEAEGFGTEPQADVVIPAGESFVLDPVTLRARPARVTGAICAELRDDLKAVTPGGTGPCEALGATYAPAHDGTTGARVTLEGPSPTEVDVAPDGTFVLPDLGPGLYSLRVAWRGYRGAALQGLRIEAGVDLSLDQAIALELARGGVTGVILSSDDPADDHAGTVVQIAGWSRSATTDRQGRFTIDGLMVSALVGDYEIVASRPQFVELRVPDPVTVLPNQTAELSGGPHVLRRRSGDVEVLEGFYVNRCAVTLRLEASESTQYRASQDPSFSGVPFQSLIAPDPLRPSDYPFELAECDGGGADGRKAIYVQFADDAGVPSATQFTELVLDRAPPAQLSASLLGGTEVALQGVTGPAWFSASQTGLVPIGLGAIDPPSAAGEPGSGVFEVFLDVEPTFANPVRVAFGPSAAVALPDPATDGRKTLYVRFSDRAGNVAVLTDDAGAPLPLHVVLDRAPPAGLSLTLRALTNVAPPDPDYTPTVQVLATLTGTDEYPDFLQLSLSNDPGFRGAVWEPFVPERPWFLPPGDGQKQVHVRFRDGAGNTVSLAPETIELLTTPPTSATLTLTSPVAPNGVVDAAATAPGGLVLALSAVGAFEVELSGPVTGGPAGFSPYATSFTGALAGPDGEKRLVATFRDRAGNTAIAPALLLTLDTTSPTAGTPSIAPGPFTASTAVTIRTPSAGADEVRLSGALAAVDGLPAGVGAYVAARPDLAATLTPGDGPKLVTVQFRDLAGNTSATVQASTTLDTTAPTGTLTLQGTLADGRASATLTARPQITAQISASDAGAGVSQMRLGNSIAELATAPWLSLQGATSWTLAPGDGTRTVYLQLMDAVGNVSSAAAPIEASLEVDGSGPMTPLLFVTAPLLGAQNATSSTAFSLQITSTDAAGPLSTGEVLVQGDLVAGGSSSTGWLAVGQGGLAFAGGLFSWSGVLSPGDGPKAVTVFVRDRAGNVAPSAQVTFLLQTSPPAGASVAITPAPWALSRAASLALSAVGATELRITGAVSDVNGAPADVNRWLPYASAANVTLTAGDGQKSVQVEFRNAAGLVAGPVTASTRLDLSAPVVSTIQVGGALGDGTASSSVTTTTNVQVALSVTDAGGLSGATIVLGEAANPAGGCVAGDLAGRPAVPYAANLPFLLAQREGLHVVCAAVTDGAGNATAPAIAQASITLDTVAPSGPTVRIAQGAQAVSALTVDVELSVIPLEPGVTQVALVNGTTLPANPTWHTIPAAPGGAWTSVNPPVYRHALDGATASGARTVSAIFRDGSRLSSPVVQASTWVDPTPPASPVVSVRQPVSIVSGTKYTNAANVSVDLSVTEDQPGGFPLQMKVACDGNLAAVAAFSPYQPTVTCPLAVEGTRTIRASFRNASGLESAVASDAVVLDQTPPTAPHLSTRPATVCTANATVCVDVDSMDPNGNGNGYQFLGGDTYGAWSPSSGGGALTGNCFTVALRTGTAAGGASNLVQLRGIDRAGNVSPPASVELIQQAVPPAPLPPGALTVIDGNGRATLRWTESAGPDVAGYLVHYGPIQSTDPADYNGASAAEGPSPIDVGVPCQGGVCEFTLNALVNGVQLSATIEPYDDAGLPLSTVQCDGNPIVPAGRALTGPVVELTPDEAPMYLASTITSYPWGQPPNPKSVAWGEDGMLYVSDAGSGLVIVDASNPRAPVVKGRYAFGVIGFPVGGAGEMVPTVVTPLGRYVYALFGAAPNQTLYSIDVSDPTAPTLVTSRNYGTVTHGQISFRAASAASHRLTFWYQNGAGQIYAAFVSDPSFLSVGALVHTVVGTTYAFSAASDILFYVDHSVTPKVVRYWDLPANAGGVAVSDVPNQTPELQGSALVFRDTTYDVVTVFRRGGRSWFFRESEGSFGPRGAELAGRWLYAHDPQGVTVHRALDQSGTPVWQRAGGLSLRALGTTLVESWNTAWPRDFRVKRGVGAVAISRDAASANHVAILELSRAAALHPTISFPKQRTQGALFLGSDLFTFNDDQPGGWPYGIGGFSARDSADLELLGWSTNGVINPQLYQYDVLHEPEQLLNRLSGPMGEYGTSYKEKLCAWDVADPTAAVDVIGCAAAVNFVNDVRDFDESYPWGIALRGAGGLRFSPVDMRNPITADMAPFGTAVSIQHAQNCTETYRAAVKAVNGGVWAFSHCRGGLAAVNLTPTILSQPAAAPVYLPLPGWLEAADLAVHGRWLYTVSPRIFGEAKGGLAIFDISNPAAPTLVSGGAYNWSCPAFANSQPRALRVSGNYAYVVDAGCGTLVVFDVTDRANPVIVQQISGGSYARPDVAGPTILGSSFGGIELFEMQ